MQKSLSLILADTKRSYFYLKELELNKISLDTIIFYSNTKKTKFIRQINNYKFVKNIFIFNTKNINTDKIVKK